MKTKGLKVASLCLIVFAFYCSSPAIAVTSAQRITGNRVLIVYAANWTGDEDSDGVQDSLEVADYYAQRRGVPASNLLGVTLTSSNYQGFDTYAKLQSELIQPVKTKLAALGAANIDVILFSYYTPWKYNGRSLDSIMMGLNLWNPTSDNTSSTYSNPYLEPNPTFGSDHGNFSHASYKVNSTDMYLISRLDGPGKVSRILSLVDEGLYADKYVSVLPGYFHGIGYVDSQGRLGDYTDAFLAANSYVQSGSYGGYDGPDTNIAYSEHHILAAGMPLKWHKGGDTISVGVYHDGTSALTAPDAMLYGGWYNLNTYRAGVFSWLPGSVATDLNSGGFGYDIHQEDDIDWAASAILHGASAVSGNVGEPYTTGTCRPHTLIYYMLNGFSYAEAAGASSPYISWQAVYVGDPLMAPFFAKTPVLDASVPGFAAGYPKPFFSEREGNLMEVRLDESGDPEVAKATIDYGATAAYGQTVTTEYYASYHRVIIPGLIGGQLYHYRVTIADPAGNSFSTDDMTFTPPAELAYGGTAWPVPGTVKFKDFDTGGEGVSYHDQTTSNYAYNQARAETGVEVTYWDPYPVWHTNAADPTRGFAAEWLKYTVDVAQAGIYSIDFIVCDSCVWGGRGTFHLEVDGTDVTGPLAVPLSNHVWQTVTKTDVPLPAGRLVLRLVMDTQDGSGTGEFDKMTFTLISPLDGDLNGDGAVNEMDLGIFADYWQTPATIADIDHSGFVDEIDFALLAQNWLK